LTKESIFTYINEINLTAHIIQFEAKL